MVNILSFYNALVKAELSRLGPRQSGLSTKEMVGVVCLPFPQKRCCLQHTGIHPRIQKCASNRKHGEPAMPNNGEHKQRGAMAQRVYELVLRSF